MHRTGDQKVIRSSTPPLSEFLRARRCQPRSVPTTRAMSVAIRADRTRLNTRVEEGVRGDAQGEDHRGALREKGPNVRGVSPCARRDARPAGLISRISTTSSGFPWTIDRWPARGPTNLPFHCVRH